MSPNDATDGTKGSSASAKADLQRAAFRQWFKFKGLNANQAAKGADISVSAIYNFLNGDTASLSSKVLRKLAAAHHSSIDSIVRGTSDDDGHVPRPIKIIYGVGELGSVFPCDGAVCLTVAEACATTRGISAALVEGEGLAPIPDGWAVLFKDETIGADLLIGKIAIVRYAGGGTRPVVRCIRKSSHPGLHTLEAFNGSITDDVNILVAQEIVSLTQVILS